MYYSNKKIDKCIKVLFLFSILIAGVTATSMHKSENGTSDKDISIIEKKDIAIYKESSTGIISSNKAKDSIENPSIKEEIVDDEENNSKETLDSKLENSEEEKVEVEKIDKSVKEQSNKQIEAKVETNKMIEEDKISETSIEENVTEKMIVSKTSNEVNQNLIKELEKYFIEHEKESNKYKVENAVIENEIKMKDFFEEVDNKTLEKLKIMKCMTKKTKG